MCDGQSVTVCYIRNCLIWTHRLNILNDCDQQHFAIFRYIIQVFITLNDLSSYFSLNSGLRVGVKYLAHCLLTLDLEATHQPFSRSLLGKSRSLFSLSVLGGEKGA